METTDTFEFDTDIIGGIIGDRDLIAIQTVNIGTLGSHVVPIVPGGLVAVGGEGPDRDSNNSGKTTFLSAVSLALGDSQWRLHHDGSHAKGLLFRSEPVGASPTEWASAAVGFVIGLFATENDAVGTALTIWIRLSTASGQYVQVRYVDGVRFARGETEADRISHSTDEWTALGRSQDISARSMSTTLFGPTPRCMSYLKTELRPPIPSLVSEELSRLKPHAIAEALIALAGLSPLLDGETASRNSYAAQVERIRQKTAERDEWEGAAEVGRAGIRARNTARERLVDAHRLWRGYSALQFLAAQAAHERLVASLAEAVAESAEATEIAEARRGDWLDIRDRGADELQTAVRDAHAALNSARQAERDATHRLDQARLQLADLQAKRAELLASARNARGVSVERATRDLAAARKDAEKASDALVLARRAHEQALAQVEAAREGRHGDVGRYLAVLSDRHIVADALLDVVNPDEEHRHEWEASLSIYRDAVVVRTSDPSDAIKALATGHAGAIVIATDACEQPQQPPCGISSPAHLHAFLTALQQRYRSQADPPSASDPVLGATVVGGYAAPIAGRDARIAAAELLADAAARALQTAERGQATAAQILMQAEEIHNGAQAAAALPECERLVQRAEEWLGAATTDLEVCEAATTAATTLLSNATAARDNHQTRVQLARANLDQALRDQEACAREVGRLQREIGQQRRDYYAGHWDDDLGAAQAFVRNDLEPHEREFDPLDLREDAGDQVCAAFDALEARSTDGPADLRHLAEQKYLRKPSSGNPVDGDIVYMEVSSALDDWLQLRADPDRERARELEEERRDWHLALTEAEKTAEERRVAWKNRCSMVRTSVRDKLMRISSAFDYIARNRSSSIFGAILEVSDDEPDIISAQWRWHVVPKWKRSPAGSHTDYRTDSNSAQKKVAAISLVLAALLSDDHARGRVLILDELGDSLGDNNRDNVLRTLQEVAQAHGITVFGAAQDSIFGNATDHVRQVLQFSRTAERTPFNEPTRYFGHDPNPVRVQMLRPWLEMGRPHDA